VAWPLQIAGYGMRLLVFGLAISSSWGNGHATLWRGLCRALADRGHSVSFFEHDVPYYAAHRDLWELPGGRLHLYPSWSVIRQTAHRELNEADAAIITSFFPDAAAAETLLLESSVPLRLFYDLDTPVTLERLARGEDVSYIGARGLRDYDVVLSYTGGVSLAALRERLYAREVVPLYGSVDPAAHQPVAPMPLFQADLSYLGTYAADRQTTLERLFHGAARRLSDRRFVLGGSQYPVDFPWSANIFYMRHVSPDLHPAFYCSSRMTLNVTRGAMAATGYCPSGRLFEAAACGVPIISDAWPGLEQFFEPATEIAVARSTEDVVAALEHSDGELQAMARRARERTLEEHTAERRAQELEDIIGGGRPRSNRAAAAPAGESLIARGATDVGNHSGCGSGDPDSAAGIF
jgi:spore maturation protein CgeB